MGGDTHSVPVAHAVMPVVPCERMSSAEPGDVTTAKEPATALPLVAFPTTRGGPAIVPAPRWRDWINAMEERWANRCLPLIVANESGWVLLNPVGFVARWSGEPSRSAIAIEFDEDVPSPSPVESHFGYGILTWSVPYLFRTPRGYNLLARGPANWPKDAVCALEGLVETDWSVATFTMNWKITRPDSAVRFEKDEPFCMVVPQQRGELERFAPEIRPLSSAPEIHAEAERWSRERDGMQVKKFLASYSKDFEDFRSAWEQDYFRGHTPEGRTADEHVTRRKIRPFAPPSADA
jgi:hypothetical protein